MPNSVLLAKKHRKRLQNQPAKSFTLILLLLALVIALDQLSKFFIRQSLEIGESLPLIGFLHITHHVNPGAAFGILGERTALVTLISLCLIVLIAGYLLTHGYKGGSQLGLCLILAGALGNTVDRLRFGYVIDFIDLRFWPIFNLADSSITAGVFVILWIILKRMWRRENL